VRLSMTTTPKPYPARPDDRATARMILRSAGPESRNADLLRSLETELCSGFSSSLASTASSELPGNGE